MKKLLLIEDNLAVLRQLSGILGRYYEVTTMMSAEAALQHLEGKRDTSFAAIVSDIRLPGIDGAEFMKIVQVSNLAPNATRILISSLMLETKHELEALSKRSGGAAFVSKVGPPPLQYALLRALGIK